MNPYRIIHCLEYVFFCQYIKILHGIIMYGYINSDKLTCNVSLKANIKKL